MHSEFKQIPPGTIELNESELGRRPFNMLEEADKAILNLLVRLNRVLESRFPNTGAMTKSSCSGHTGGNPELHSESPYIRIDSDATKTTPEQRQEIETLIKVLFQSAASSFNTSGSNKVNLRFDMSPDPISWPWAKESEPSLFYSFIVGAKFSEGQTWQVLALFWQNVEAELGKLEQVCFITNFSEEDFRIPESTSYREELRSKRET